MASHIMTHLNSLRKTRYRIKSLLKRTRHTTVSIMFRDKKCLRKIQSLKIISRETKILMLNIMAQKKKAGVSGTWMSQRSKKTRMVRPVEIAPGNLIFSTESTIVGNVAMFFAAIAVPKRR